MKKNRFMVVFFVLLAFGFCFAVPAQDLPETAYDESQADTYEPAPCISGVASGTTASSETAVDGTPPRLREVPSHVVRNDHAELPRPTAPRLVLSLLCTFLC